MFSWSSLTRGARPAVAVLLLLILLGVAISPTFRTTGNAVNVLRQLAPLGVLALGQTLVLIGGGVDLSVGMLIGLIVPVGALIMGGQDSQILSAIGVMIGIGLLTGLVNGMLVAWAGVHPFVLTFGMMALLQGITFLVTDYRTVGQVAPGFTKLFRSNWGLPSSFWFLVILALMSWILLVYTPYGRYLRATGSHRFNAMRAGIQVKQITCAAYILSGVFAGIAGVLVLGRLEAGYPLAGSGYELNSIVAAILGGATFAGGEGSVPGALAGAAILAVISNLLNLLQVSAYVQELVQGLIIITAIGIRLKAFGSRSRLETHAEAHSR